MQKQVLADSLVVLSAILFSILFWQEKMGVNALLYSALLVGGTLILRPENRAARMVQLTASGVVVTAMLIVWNNSGMSKVMYVVSLFLFVGFSQQRVLRFLWFGFLLAIISALETPMKLYRKLQTNLGSTSRWLAPFHFLRIAIIPTGVFFVFFGIYYLANADFAGLVDKFGDSLSFLFDFELAFPRFWIFFWGFIIASAAFWPSSFTKLADWQASQSDFLTRNRKQLRWLPLQIRILSLKNEYQQAVLLVFALNALLGIVNVLDVCNVWFQFEEKTAAELSQAVHGGTFLLIFSILLAMLVLLFYFRGNLNFYADNELLKKGACLWIAQNAVLAVSLCIRNLRYINDFGLAYYRIGVLIFLVLVFIGLATLFLKIWQQRSLYFLLNYNSWAAYALLIALCFINWDVFITRYNLRHTQQNGLDTYFLLHIISDKNLFVLEQNLSTLKQHGVQENDVQQKWETFLEEQENYSWLSWNYADWQNWRYAKERQ